MSVEESSSSVRIVETTTGRPLHDVVRSGPSSASLPSLHDAESSSRSSGTARSFPPSALQTPSSSGRRSARGSERFAAAAHPSRPIAVSFGSPFSSPPLEASAAAAGKRRSRPAKTRSQLATHPLNGYDSPFLSPMPDRRRPDGAHARRERPEPLVLDPSARSSPNFHSRSFPHCDSSRRHRQSHHLHDHSSTRSARSVGGGSGGAGIPAVQKLFQVATQGLRDHHATAAIAYSQNNGLLHHATPSVQGVNGTMATASSLASRSSHAGFLLKLGRNIPEFKRRFFVLKPESNLYYYVSPNDVEPRGRIDLEGSTVEVWDRGADDADDGTRRFLISWPASADNDDGQYNKNKHHSTESPRQIVLEARSKEVAEEWMRVMKQDRVSTLKDQLHARTSETTAFKNRIVDLERQIDHFRMVEKDRDGALEDARNWRSKFEKLDEALRLLTQQIRQPPASTDGEGRQADNSASESGKQEEEKKDEEIDNKQDDCKESSAAALSNPGTDVSNDTETTPTQSNRRGAALLDDFARNDMNVEEMLEVPGTYFSALSNACRQQRESLRLASIEAATAVEDTVEANERVQTIQKRMEKAEKQLLKLWEENCSVRKTLKQKNRDRRVLVKEVKELQSTVAKLQQEAESRNNLLRYSMKVPDNDGQMADTMIGSDEERLIDELEEHVASSIQLHERLLAGTGFGGAVETDFNSSMDQSISTNQSSKNLDAVDPRSHKGGIRFDGSSGKGTNGNLENDQPKLLSLLDDDSDSDSSTEDEEQKHRELENVPDEVVSAAPSISSTKAEMGDNENQCVNSVTSINIVRSTSSVGTLESTPERPNPMLELDKDDLESDIDTASTSQPEILTTRVTENGRATARLACPLADVADTVTSARAAFFDNANEELRVQHLTFYSMKIGIQFQKAPPAPVKPRGLLTDAVTADLNGDANGSYKTAGELRSVASIASLANVESLGLGKEHCPLALPDDIVLVCGFQGFDDSGTNQRPRLGARLVAFDGVSVEVGKWNFDSIRKAIKARGRPLTLSFRNDFLTTDQRAVLTKAVMEVDAKRPHDRTTARLDHQISAASSYASGMSAESDGLKSTRFSHIRNEFNVRSDLPSKGTDGKNRLHFSQPASSNSSISSGYLEQPDRRLSSTSTSTNLSSNLRSFSDVGSSFVSSSFAPLMTNLLKGVSSSSSQHGRETTTRRFEPEYLHRKTKRSESTPQHQDFRSNLL